MHKTLAESDAEKLISRYAPVAKSLLTINLESAKKAAQNLKFPVVLKLISIEALHKTEIGGVKIVRNLQDLELVYNKFISLSKKKKIKLQGILIQEFVKGQELLIGIKKDATFGHVLLCGLGGVLVEVFKDVAFRVCPITNDDAQSMLDELKSKKLLTGFRGAKPVNLKILKNTLVRISKIPKRHPSIAELDINPFIINYKVGKVADARIIFES